jgi:fumarate reductase flavoprotein subunit
MQRREFLRSTAAASAVLMSRLSLAAEEPWDLIVVGAGTAGLPAALHAAERGARVLLIDPDNKIGGTLHMAFGQVSGAGTRQQADLGIKDSPDIHYDDIMRITRDLADPDIVRQTVDRAGDMINWLLDRGLEPLPGHPVTGDTPGRPAYSVRRYLWAEDAGRAILRILLREIAPYLKTGQIVAQVGTRVTGLLTADNGDVEGVRAQSGSKEISVRGRNVLLTSGGYAMNPVLFERLVGHPAYAGSSQGFVRGDGLQLAVSVGGWLRGQELHRAGTGSILSAQDFVASRYARFNTTPQVREPWEIWVNNLGLRFIREDEPDYYARSLAVLDLPELRYNIVFDQAAFDAAPGAIGDWSREKVIDHFEDGRHPMFARADSIDALATKANIDVAGLRKTVDDYNAGVQNGRDPLGREHRPLPIIKPPFYSVTQLGHSATSSTGVVVNKDLAIVRGDGEAVRNLYAAGEILGAGVTLAKAFTPGMMLTPALTLGALLGRKLSLKS